MQEYDSQIPQPRNDGFSDPVIKKALSIMSEWHNVYSDDFNKREHLNRLADESMKNADSPAVTVKKINNQLSYIAVRKVNKQMAERIFKVTGGKIPAEKREVIKKMYIRFLELAGYRNTWLDHIQMLRTGDQMITAGANEQYFSEGKGFPYTIAKKSITQLFFPGWVTSLVDKGDNRHATQYVEIVFDGLWDTAIEKYPWLEENGGTSGMIPMNSDDWDLNTQQEKQRAYESDRRTQVARFVDEDKKIVQYFGGRTVVAGDKLEGEDFPHMDRYDEPTKNVFHKKCFPLANGLLATGILQATHKLSILDGMLQSIGFTYEIINLNAIKVISTGMSPDTFKNEYNQALKDQLNLKEGVIYSKGENIGISNTSGPSIINDMFNAIDQIIKNFARLDIIIDDSLTDPGKTLGALNIEQVSQSRGIRELQSGNAPEEQRFHDFTVDWIIQNIDDDDPTELPGINARVFDGQGRERTVNGRTVTDENGEEVYVNYTVGNLRKVLAEEGVRIEIVPDSGVKLNEAVSKLNAERNLNRYASLGLMPLVMQELRKIKVLEGESEVDLDFLEQQQIPQEQGAPQGLPLPTENEPI